MLSLGDEIVNINGKRLRGVTVAAASTILAACGRAAEAVVARTEIAVADPDTVDSADTIVLWSEPDNTSQVIYFFWLYSDIFPCPTDCVFPRRAGRTPR